MTLSVGLVPVCGLCLSFLSLPVPRFTPGNFFQRVCPMQHRINKSHMGGREDTVGGTGSPRGQGMGAQGEHGET